MLIGAYACGPLAEPEARAGWEFAKAATRDHDVWVITRNRFRESIETAIAETPGLADRLHVSYLDLPEHIVRLKRRAWDVYWYYLLWQRSAGRLATELHDEHAFEVAHHVTFANDWMPSGLTALPIPLVWGPVGGSSQLPVWRLARWLGPRGTATELVRTVLTRVARSIGGNPTARRARLVVAQNPQVADYFAGLGADVVVEPNASLDDLPARASKIEPKTAVFAGRLLAWKGAALAIDALARPEVADWRLRIFGAGYDERRLRRRAEKRGVDARVEFCGHRPRTEVLAAVAQAQVFLFPSMHDQAGWVVAEASTIGCPVVCLPLGGPPVLAEPNAHIASLRGDIAGNVARQITIAAAAGGTPTNRWRVDRLPDTVSGWYAAASDETSSPETAPAGRRRLRVLESFGIPKPTTNPYITQLHQSLVASPDTEVLTFGYKQALLGKYDVVHLHWPELMVGGHNWRGRTARRFLATLTTLRWQVTRTPVVRTRHNLERPTNINRFDHWFLDRVDKLTTLDIRLNDFTPEREGKQAVTIPHGHYRDWFAEMPQSEPTAGQVGYVGLVRRYKGVEDLIGAFVELDDDDLSLHIAGKPSTPELAAALIEAAGSESRVTFDPRYLDDAELVHAMSAAELIVLPYRHMHNSGTVLAALSVDRPVLVPDNEVNRALAEEVGAGWVLLFSGDLSADDLTRARAERAGEGERPDLSKREWASAASDHIDAFRRAISRR